MRVRWLTELAPIRAEVIFGAREELAATIEDVLARRIGLQMYGWRGGDARSAECGGFAGAGAGLAGSREARIRERICSED